MAYKKRKQNKIVKANKLCCDVCSLESYKRALQKHTATFHYKYVLIAFMLLCANILIRIFLNFSFLFSWILDTNVLYVIKALTLKIHSEVINYLHTLITRNSSVISVNMKLHWKVISICTWNENIILLVDPRSGLLKQSIAIKCFKTDLCLKQHIIII